MNILDLLNHKNTHLPIEQSIGEDFRILVSKKLGAFLDELENIDYTTFRIHGSNLDVKDYKRKIEYYYSDSPSNSYKKLSEALDEAGIRDFLDKDLQINSITLVDGTTQPYHQTSFGMLEHSLNDLEVNPN